MPLWAGPPVASIKSAKRCGKQNQRDRQMTGDRVTKNLKLNLPKTNQRETKVTFPTRRILFAVCAGALTAISMATFAGSAMAADYPNKPIKVIVPFGAGGGTDSLVRILLPQLESELGTDIVVINAPGAGSITGSRRILGEEADGYTVLINHATLLTNIALGKADFTTADFTTAASSVESELVVVVPTSSPTKNLAELYKQMGSGEPVIAGVNLGAINHFAMLMVQKNAGGGKFRFVQTGGGAKTSAALLGNHIHAGVLALSEAAPLVESGDIRVLAVLSDERSALMPEAATSIEQGNDAQLSIAFTWFFRAGTPDEIVSAFGDAVGRTMANKELRATLEARSMVPTSLNAAEASASIDKLMGELTELAKGLE